MKYVTNATICCFIGWRDDCLSLIAMKKIWIIGVTLSLCGLTHATTVNAPSSLVGANSLYGEDYYTWGIGITLTAGQSITSAAIDWSNVKLTAAGTTASILYTDLVNSQKSGVTTYVDNDAAGDALATKFPGNYTSVGSQAFASVGTSYATLDYVLNATQLAALNSYLTSGKGMFCIGIDPDCHYNVGGLSFIYTVGSPPSLRLVPDTATTALLLIIGLAGVEIFRRKFAVAS
jgi:hypothetical protein